MSGPRPRVVVAGLGDTGVLTAVRLAKRYDVVGISSKPALVSGQELGIRLAEPEVWKRNYLRPFGVLRGLDRVRRVQGVLEELDLGAREVRVRDVDGGLQTEPYDVLVISTGVTNGFWRRPDLESPEQVEAGLQETHRRLAEASSIAVVGGGAAAVSCAANAARVWPDKQVDLYFPRERALTEHHRRVWDHVSARLEQYGVGLHPGHRAEIPEGFATDRITHDPLRWTTGQPEVRPGAVIWAVGRSRPNTAWLPEELLDEEGYVRTGSDLRVPGTEGVFAIGDVAATDPQRSSARNFTYRLLVRNITAYLSGRPLATFRAPRRRWGSVIGTQPDGVTIYTVHGKPFRVPRRVTELALQAVATDIGIYRGVRRR